MPTVFCTRCGHENPEDSRYCASCGVALSHGHGHAPETPTEVTSTISISGIESLDGEHLDTGNDDVADSALRVTVEALAPGSALLVVKRGPNAGSRFLLDAEVTTAGRHPESDIFLDDVTVSRRHAEFRRTERGFSVHDVGSLNGTYVNRQRIDEAPLTGGDEVQIGKFRLVFLTGPHGAGGAPDDFARQTPTDRPGDGPADSVGR